MDREHRRGGRWGTSARPLGIAGVCSLPIAGALAPDAPGRGRGVRLRASAGTLLVVGALLASIGLVSPRGSRAPLRWHAGISAALAGAIHARFGPGPIGLGSAPLVRGIVPSAGGWKAVAPASIRARISRDGMASVRLDRWASASLRAVGVGSGRLGAGLSVRHSSLAGGRLVQGMGSFESSYRVTAGGLEQRFTLSSAPVPGASQLVVRLGSDESWRAVRDGSGIVPVGARFGPLVYTGLRATDASGRRLPARFESGAGGPRIVVDARGARFPVSIDPTWTSTSTPTATLTNASGTSDDQFGAAVALSSDGTTALVGAPGASNGLGAAFIYHVSSEGSWVSSSAPAAKLTYPSGPDQDEFGASVALSSDGTVAMVGANAAYSASGAVYVFRASSEGSWTSSSHPAATLTDGTGQADDFGTSIALSKDGTSALIGAPNANSGSLVGAAYVFHVSSEDSWASSSAPSATLTEGGSEDAFGTSVALSSDGTTALIGAYNSNGSAGTAYIFHASSEGSWASSSHPVATLSDGGAAGTEVGEFGAPVTLSSDGTTALISAPDVNNFAGAAYIFHVSSEAAWVSSSAPAATLSNPAGANADEFGSGSALSANGATALISADADGTDAQVGENLAYVFEASSEGSWASSSHPAATLSNSSTTDCYCLGGSVALSSDGTTALVSALLKSGADVFTPASGGKPPPPSSAGKPTISGSSLSGLSKGRPRLQFKATHGSNAPDIKAVSVSLPSGLSFRTTRTCKGKGKKRHCTTTDKGLAVSGAKIGSASASGRRVSITLKSASASVSVTVKAPGLRETKVLEKKVSKHRIKTLELSFKITNASGTSATISVKLK